MVDYMEYIAQGKEFGLSGSEFREFTKQRTKDKLESDKIASENRAWELEAENKAREFKAENNKLKLEAENKAREFEAEKLKLEAENKAK